jgi:hypothetical protein
MKEAEIWQAEKLSLPGKEFVDCDWLKHKRLFLCLLSICQLEYFADRRVVYPGLFELAIRYNTFTLYLKFLNLRGKVCYPDKESAVHQQRHFVFKLNQINSTDCLVTMHLSY